MGLLCLPVALILPGYLMMVMGGWRGLRGVMPAVLVSGISFGAMQYLVSSYIGPQLVDIAAALVTIICLVGLLRIWQPADNFVMTGEGEASLTLQTHSLGRTLLAWSPYIYLVVFVLLWGSGVLGSLLTGVTVIIEWPGLHNAVERMSPVVASPAPYAATYTLNWLAAAGTACAFATVAAAVTLKVSPGDYVRLLGRVLSQLAFTLLTIASVLGLAYLMNYSGATVTLGLAFAATGVLFPYFSAMLGWLAVFLTGSVTSANALFGNLQVVTANSLGLDPVLMASANSTGGMMGKMISLQSIAVAVAATGMARSEEGRLFRFTVKHSIIMASTVGVLAAIYAYVL